MAHTLNCYNCGQQLSYELPKVGRGEECPGCRYDVRVCFNCSFYDKNSYNECREPQADRVVEKGKANYCDFFTLRSGSAASAKAEKDDVLKQLDDLFKK